MTQSTNDYSILVVDDDSKFRQLICELLRPHGCRVIEARSAREATAILASENPGLLIVDYRLPMSDGLNWIAGAREAGRNMPAVLISGTWLDKKTFDIARNIYRVSLILRKPILPRLFINQIKSLLPAVGSGYTGEERRITTSQPVRETSALSTTVQAALERVRNNYLADLPQTWSELKAAVEASKQSDSNQDSFARAIQLAHRLRGSAGSLGLNIIGQISGKIEDSLDWIRTAPSDSDSFWQKILDNLAEGEKYIAAGLFVTPTTSAVIPAEKADNSGALASKVLLLNPSASEKDCGIKSYWQGYVHINTVNSLKNEELNSLAQGKLDAAILQVSSKEDLFNLAKTIRSSPRSKSLPLALVDEERKANLSPFDLIYAGISKVLDESYDEKIEALTEHLLALSRRRKPRIMNIEDEPAVSQVIGSYLTHEGMLVYAVDEPIAVMSSLDEIRPDLILLDVNMSGLSGYDVCRMIRQSDQWHWLPILFLTASSDIESRALAFEAGADDFLSKPIVPQELIKRVQHHIDNPKRQIVHKQRDAWTGLLEPRSFLEHLEAAWADAVSLNHSISFATIQMDALQQYSLNHGMQTVFSVLNLMADLITVRFPSEAIRGSWGEFGFGIAIPDIHPEDMHQSLELLLAEYGRLLAERGLPECIFRIGEAAAQKDGTKIEEILSLAKLRLASAQADGKLVVSQSNGPIRLSGSKQSGKKSKTSESEEKIEKNKSA